MEYLDNNNEGTLTLNDSKKTNNISNFLEFSVGNESSKNVKTLTDNASSSNALGSVRLPHIVSPR
jgi:hypothetical protein